jgi:D-amino-acid dehydrogenase
LNRQDTALGTKKDLVIVGGGIIGLSTAYFALEKGWNVTVVERNAPHGDNCSQGNSGIIVPSHFVPLAAPGIMGQAIRWMRDPESPFSLKPSLSLDMLKWGLRFYLASTRAQVDQAAPILRDLNLASRDLYIRWSETGIDSGLAKKGLLMLCKTDTMLHEEKELAQQARDLGIPAQVLDAQETAALDPNVTMSIAGSVYYPKDCHLDPSRLIASLLASIEAKGGKVLWNHHVTGWKMLGSSIVALETSHGELTGDEFVLCGGVWSDDLVKPLRLSIPMLAGKGYSLTLPTPIELPSVCSILCEARVAVTPMGDKLRFGGTMTIGKPDQVIAPEKIRGITKSVASYLPRFKAQHFDGIQPWVGLRPVTPDGLPYIGRTNHWKNLTVAAGHAMMGISLGPITGQLTTQIVTGERTSVSVERLSPDRYAA